MIFPLPYSSYINAHGVPALSRHSSLVLEATFEYLKQLSPSVIPAKALREPESRLSNSLKIILIAEQTYGSKTHKTADLMRQFLVEKKVNIQNIQKVNKIANNTYEQLETLKSIVESNVVTFIAFAFHVPRIKIISDHLKLNIKIITVEEVLKSNSVLSMQVLALNNAPKMQKIYIAEKVFTQLAKLDKHGLIPKTFSRLFGPRAPLL